MICFREADPSLNMKKLLVSNQRSAPSCGVICCLALCLFLPALSFAQTGAGLPSFRQPPQVRIIGILVPLDDKQPSKSTTLRIYVKGKSWKLHIQEITALTATTQSGWALLRNLLPPKLRLIGADALLLPLTEETIAGKPLTLEGRLYVGAHQLFVSSAHANEDK